MKASDKRRHPRVPVSLKSFVYRAGESRDPIACEIQDLSQGGAMLRCSRPVFRAGDKIVLEIHYADGFLIKGRISKVENVAIELEEDEESTGLREIWAEGDSGTSRVEFEALPPKREKAFHKLLELLHARPKRAAG